jgi:hypothetical protein
MFLAVAILLLTGGECVTPLFADQQSKECCAKGMCQRSQKKDPCCQTTPPAATHYFETASKVALDRIPAFVVVVAPHTAEFSLSSSTGIDRMDTAFQWPPGSLRGVSLPLLV